MSLELIRFAWAIVKTPFMILWELFGPDDFDKFEAEQRERLDRLAEGR